MGVPGDESADEAAEAESHSSGKPDGGMEAWMNAVYSGDQPSPQGHVTATASSPSGFDEGRGDDDGDDDDDEIAASSAAQDEVTNAPSPVVGPVTRSVSTGTRRLLHKKAMKKTQRARDWEISKVVFGDGSVDPHGFQLEVGKWYGIQCSAGGHKEYHEVCPESLNLFTRYGSQVNVSITVGSVTSREIRLPEKGPSVTFRAGMKPWQKNRKVARAVCKWTKEKRGVGNIIVGPGERGASGRAVRFLEKEKGNVLVHGGKGSCVCAAVANAVWVLKGEEKALEAKKMVVEKGLKAKNLKEVRDWMEQVKMGVATLVATNDRRNEESWYGFLVGDYQN